LMKVMVVRGAALPGKKQESTLTGGLQKKKAPSQCIVFELLSLPLAACVGC
jgi:hypothetical protein